MSTVWKFFNRIGSDKNKATCNDCKKEYTCTGGTTSSLKNHLEKKHKELYQQYIAETNAKLAPSQKRLADDQSSNKQPKMKERKIEDCMNETEAALDKAITDAIVDFLADAGVAFRVVGLASFERLMKIANRGIKLKSPVTYSRLVKVKAAEIEKELIEIIAAVKGDLNCVGFTTDLWTSHAGDPFMSLTIHFIDK